MDVVNSGFEMINLWIRKITGSQTLTADYFR